MSKKIVTLKYGEETRNLKFGMNALIELEQLLGKPLTAISEEMSMSDLRAMFFVALKHEDKELTLEGTGDILDDIISELGMQEMSNKIGEALKKAIGNTGLPSK